MSVYMALLILLTVVVKASIVVILLLLARGCAWLFNMLLLSPPFDPLKNLPGPDGSALQNHFREIMDPKISPDTHHEWSKKYGRTFRFHGFGKHDYRLMSFDLRVVSHVLNSPIYEKPWQTRSLLSRLLGRGIFAMEGAEHKVQRKLIGPAFTTQSVKAMTPIFFQKAEELRDRWDALISQPSPSPSSLSHATISVIPNSPAATQSELNSESINTIDISHWISRATFDVIGLAGFDYHFHSLHDESEEVYLAYRRMFNVADKGPGLKGLLQLYFPIIETLWPDDGTRTTQESLRVIHEAGKNLVASKKAAILAEKASAEEIQEKDIISLLIKSNLLSDPSKRMSDADLLDQLSTFLFAGSDSTSLAISWCFHLLSQHPDIQTRLRNEIMSIPINLNVNANVFQARTSSTDKRNTLDMPPDSGFAEMFSLAMPAYSTTHYSPQTHADTLDTLPLLDAIVRETLRICPPVHGTIRTATADDRIPISHPVVLRDGTIIRKDEFLSIRKGSYVHIPIEGLNFCEEIWGDDARKFNPDRWTSLPPSARAPTHPGLANLMTFSFGPHSCPGYKFSILEMKVFIATLLPQFVFDPAEGLEVGKFNAILTRPYVVDHFELGTRLPLVVKRFGAI